jgi:hypothetical protein
MKEKKINQDLSGFEAQISRVPTEKNDLLNSLR